ncbi:uncharacterized protein F4807DRAFT_271223 [Annulohypoxylon truncatum]|uniref:uncharacterized protein n=1 Tax=Annulohypoxylon truncatum TaxID=327061 RepID=UPI00200811C4|nr:uncharacterized protein F4807DRAFT_271223 [Annulohypoxylon truncatum]KAI1205678.1 hypothetical protein F4807DRAFT_271223 [Annulohypoxylon truncatum]
MLSATLIIMIGLVERVRASNSVAWQYGTASCRPRISSHILPGRYGHFAGGVPIIDIYAACRQKRLSYQAREQFAFGGFNEKKKTPVQNGYTRVCGARGPLRNRERQHDQDPHVPRSRKSYMMGPTSRRYAPWSLPNESSLRCSRAHTIGLVSPKVTVEHFCKAVLLTVRLCDFVRGEKSKYVRRFLMGKKGGQQN